MNCKEILDMFYEDDDLPLYSQILIGFHIFFCSGCAQDIERYKAARAVMKNDFFPSSPCIEDSLMAKLCAEEAVKKEQTELSNFIPALSTRRWIIGGIILLISLATAFFGLEFKNLASESGMSFMLPMGITIGIVLTTYGALFIGSHLKELSERFGL